MWYISQKFNPEKHPMMPEEYPWQTSDTHVEGWVLIDQEQLDQLYAMDISAYLHYTNRDNIPDVSPRQFRSALVLSNISIASVEAAMDQLAEPHKSLAKIQWEYSLAFQRRNPLVAMVGNVMGKTPEELDSIWAFAGTL